MTEEERARVRAFIADPNGPVPQKARPAGGAGLRRTPTTPLEKKAGAWATWFYARMAEANSEDPAANLPDMAAKIEELIATKIAEEVAPLRRRIAELERAKAGSIVTAWKLNRERFEAVPYMANGSAGPAVNLRGLFEQYWSETGGVS
jgi:hypothetical protein